MAMIKKYFFMVGIFFSTLQLQAQFTDNMESYTNGEPISVGHWTEWGCDVGIGCNIMSTSEKARSGNLSGWIPGDGTTNAVLDLGNKPFGEWGLEFWVYIPSGKEASFSLQGEVPIVSGESIVGDILFNPNLESPGVGKITDTALGEVSFNFPQNEWFPIVIWWDIYLGISSATWELTVGGIEVVYEGTSFTNENGDYPTSLGGILFSSNSENATMFLDDFYYQDGPIIINVEDHSSKNFTLYPNPTKNIINISSQESINRVAIYNIQASLVKHVSPTNSIDVSNLTSGMYFIEVHTDSSKSVQKFIKN